MNSARIGAGPDAFFDEARRDAIRAHVDAILATTPFTTSARSTGLLRYLIARFFAGETDQTNEYAIGLDVFERPPSFDPRLDSIVRTEMSRLRKKLKDYYAAEGLKSPMRIELPLRSYVPQFVFDQPPASTAVSRRPWMWMIAAVVVAAGIAAWMISRKPAPRNLPPTLAILPFVNMSGDAAKEYIGDSLAEELTESLSESRALRVVARTSSFQFKNQSTDMREIGRKLNASALLEGSVQAHGSGLRVIAQLIQSSDGYHLWSATYDTPAAQLDRVESEIARAAAHALLPRSAPEPDRAAGTSNPAAHDLYLRSIYQLQQRTPDSARQSLELAQKAVALDPRYVRAYGAMVRALSTLSVLGVIPAREAADRSREAFQKALELDPDYSDGHAWAAMDAYTVEWNWPKAQREFERALAARGFHGQVNNLYGWSLMTRRRFDEARAQLQLAEDLDPASPGSRTNMVTDLIFERKFTRAKQEIDGIFKLNPKSLQGEHDLEWIAAL
ncbi:MAG TPA: hypothetical protein VMB85_10165 [Bryobacteraceae bacterium]|nr:hypothetical protein [Bryobacteraceae bacterium]